jgi:hypothetical protein
MIDDYGTLAILHKPRALMSCGAFVLGFLKANSTTKFLLLPFGIYQKL